MVSAAFTAVAGLALLPSVAHAETSRRVDVPVVHTLSGNQLVLSSALSPSQTFTAGDCTEWSGSFLTLTLTDGDFGDVNVHWKGRVSTNRTFSHDVWHARFDLKDSSGNVLTTIGGLDGPDMVYTGGIYEFDRGASTRMSPSEFLAVAKVDWWGDC
jgi:hypothetical protein